MSVLRVCFAFLLKPRSGWVGGRGERTPSLSLRLTAIGCDCDGRRQSLTLRPQGHALVPRLAALADQNDAASFEGLTPEERGELERLLRKLAAAQNLNAAPIT